MSNALTRHLCIHVRVCTFYAVMSSDYVCLVAITLRWCEFSSKSLSANLSAQVLRASSLRQRSLRKFALQVLCARSRFKLLRAFVLHKFSMQVSLGDLSVHVSLQKRAVQAPLHKPSMQQRCQSSVFAGLSCCTVSRSQGGFGPTALP